MSSGVRKLCFLLRLLILILAVFLTAFMWAFYFHRSRALSHTRTVINNSNNNNNVKSPIVLESKNTSGGVKININSSVPNRPGTTQFDGGNISTESHKLVLDVHEMIKAHGNDVKTLSVTKSGHLDEAISKVSKNIVLKTDKSKSVKSISKTKLTNRIYESGHLDDEINIDQICPNEGSNIKLLIMITSAQSHREARLAIRHTWGSYGSRRYIAKLFILGRSNNSHINTELTEENFLYGDLVRGRFIDTYTNLTLKTISALEWVDKHCSRAKFILKTDDDVFINVPQLLTFLEEHANEKRVIYGHLANTYRPIRNKTAKYHAPVEEFTGAIFPPFTTGPAYLLSADTIHDLYQRALQQTYLRLEDVFTTGIVAKELGIRRINVKEFRNKRMAFNACAIRKTISVHKIKSNEQFNLWQKLMDSAIKCT